MGTLATVRSRAVARPLKVLVPLIQRDLIRAAEAGSPYYISAGEELLEAKPQVALGSWGRWLNKNFTLNERTARRYMTAARAAAEDAEEGSDTSVRSLLELTGETTRRRENRHQRRKVTKPLREAMENVDVDAVSQHRQTRQDEIELHRELALELIDIGYKALATRLHPDRGGSRDAMARLNRIREVFKEVAHTRRFV